LKKGSFPIDLWYLESHNHDFENNKFQMRTAHFSQLIWKNSKFIGVGFSKNKISGANYLVINYYPAGNIDDEYKMNVFTKI